MVNHEPDLQQAKIHCRDDEEVHGRMEQRNPEGAIEPRELGIRSRLGVRCELLPQDQLDDRLLIAASEEGKNRAKVHSHEVEQSLHRERDPAPFRHSGTG